MERQAKRRAPLLARKLNGERQWAVLLTSLAIILAVSDLLLWVAPLETETKGQAKVVAGLLVLAIVASVLAIRRFQYSKRWLQTPIQIQGIGMPMAVPSRAPMVVVAELVQSDKSLCHACGDYVNNSEASVCCACRNRFHQHCMEGDEQCPYCASEWRIGPRADEAMASSLAMYERGVAEHGPEFSPLPKVETCYSCELTVTLDELDESGICLGCRNRLHTLQHTIASPGVGCGAGMLGLPMMGLGFSLDEYITARYGEACAFAGIVLIILAISVSLINLIAGLLLYARLKLTNPESYRQRSYVNVLRVLRNLCFRILILSCVVGAVVFIFFGLVPGSEDLDFTSAGVGVGTFVGIWVCVWAFFRLTCSLLH